MWWFVLWYLCGMLAGAAITFKSYEETGAVSLGDDFRVVVVSPLFGVVGLLLLLLIMSDDFTLYKKK